MKDIGSGGEIQRMAISRRLVRMELAAIRYQLVLVALLPSRLAYGIGTVIGELQYQVESPEREMVLKCLELALGGQLDPEGRARVARVHFRRGVYREIDRLSLAGSGRRLVDLVRVEGLEHVEQALSQGRGAVIGSAHFGSYEAAVGCLWARGFPIRLIAFPSRHRHLSLWQKLVRGRGTRLLIDRVYRSRLLQPSIYVEGGTRGEVVAKASRALQRNEVVLTMLDLVESPSRHPNAPAVPFLNGLAYLPSGVVRIAKSAGAPMLILLIHRSRDWRHQVMEISAPIPTEGEVNEVNRRCARVIEDAIRSEPAHWRSWSYWTMASLGLLQKQEKN